MGLIKCRMGFWETEWAFSGVGQKPVGFPEKSMGFTFNGAVTGGGKSFPTICHLLENES